jgi:hypothetical protein
MKERVSFTEQIRIALSKPLWYKSLFQQCIIPMAAYIESAGGLRQIVCEDLPEFSIANGELNVSQKIDIENTGIRLIIDTSVESFRTEDAELVAAGMEDSMPVVYLVSKTNIVCNSVPMSMNWFPQNMNYTNEDLYQDAPMLLVGYAVLFIFRTVIGYLISALFFSLFGMIVNRALRLKLRFQQIFLVALYAKSVEILLEAVLEVLGISLLYYIGTIIGIFITCSYMTRGMTSLVKTVGDSKD